MSGESSSVPAFESAYESAAQAVTGSYETGKEEASQLAKSAVDTVRQSSFVQRIILPPSRFAYQKYNESPLFIKFSLATFAAMSAVPVACFVGFMSIVAVGLCILGGVGFAVVEGGFGVFASFFLLPALGLALLIAGGVGLTTLFVYGSYMAIVFGIGLVRGRGEQARLEEKGERVQADLDRRMRT